MDKKSARIRRAARARHMMREQGVTRFSYSPYSTSYLRTSDCTERFRSSCRCFNC